MCSTSSETKRSRTWLPFLGELAWNETLPGPTANGSAPYAPPPPPQTPHLLLDSMIPSKLSAGSCMQKVVVSWFRSNLSPLGAGQTSPPEVNYTYTRILPNQTCWPPLHGHG